MRRKTLALSACALVTTLSACSGQTGGTTQSQDSGQGSAEQGAQPVSNISTLISRADSSMNENQTVTVSTDISGGPMAEMGDTKCQVNITESKMACAGMTSMVITKEAMYTKAPMPPGMGDQSKPWIKIEFGSNGMLSQAMKNSAKFKKLTDFEAMLPAGSKITGSAQEKVNGKPATRYDVTVDLTKQVSGKKKLVGMARETLRKSGVKKIDKTVWISTEGLPLKAETTLPPRKIMNRQIPKTTTTVTYSEWGKPVDITVPPASKVRKKMDMPSIPGMPQPPQ